MAKKLILALGLLIGVVTMVTLYAYLTKGPEIVCYPDGGSAQCFVSRVFNSELHKLLGDESMFRVRDDGSEYLSWEFACEKYFDKFADTSNEIYKKYTASSTSVELKDSDYICHDSDSSVFMYYGYRFGDHDLGFCYDGRNQNKNFIGEPNGFSCVE